MEAFTPDERRALSPYFTELDSPVFALVNLPEVVKSSRDQILQSDSGPGR